jgi:hypothetical protein
LNSTAVGVVQPRQRDIVAGAIAQLLYALGELLHWKRAGYPARVMPDNTLDFGIGVAADEDGRMRLP